MDAPPIQYAKTSDGYDIAYNVGGNGRTLLMMPYPFSHARLSWTAPGLQETCVQLAEKFRVVHFDARGQGLSTRGLPDSHRLEDYLVDIEALVGASNLDRFLLFGSIAFWRVAVAYASKNPQRVEALILLNPDGSLAPSKPSQTTRSQNQNDWDTYLMMVGSTVSPAPTDTPGRFSMRDRMKECVEEGDYSRMRQAFATCDLHGWLPRISVPTLILSQRGPWNQATVPEVAATIPGARLVMLEDFGNMLYSASGETPGGITAIEEFVDSLSERNERHADEALRSVPASMPISASLSARQSEILRLIAAGKTNREIAEALVLSERTVERHVADIYARITVSNRAQAAVYAKEHGIA
jgi:DNA-binding CsgD family transcriptional regulator/pimeloyl-ACP methyl ester carboxylesterase